MKRIVRMGAVSMALLAATAAHAVAFSLVSLRSDGTPPSSQSGGNDQPAITPDGRYVVFTANATGLVTPDATGYQIYLRDRVAGTTELISVNMTGGAGNNSSSGPSISDDGCRVVFMSFASDLVAGDANSTQDAFVRDRCAQPRTTSLVSVSSGGVQATSQSYDARISGDGSKVAFMNYAGNLVTPALLGSSCLYMRNLNAGTTTAITAPNGRCTGAESPDLSRDGSRVVFWSLNDPGTSNYINGVWQILLYDFNTAAFSVVSASSSGVPQTQGSPGEGVSTITAPAISSDGGYVAFRSRGAGLVPVAGGGISHVYIKELATGAIVRASVDSAGNPGNADSSGSGQGYRPGLAKNGKTVTFLTSATNLAPETGGFYPNVVAHNPYTGRTVGFTASQTLSGLPAITDGGELIVAYSGYQLDPAFASRGMFVFSAGTTTNLAVRYRLYSPGTFEHLYTTDFNEYSVLPVCCSWVPEGAIYRILSGPGSYLGIAAVPYYRLYNPFSHQHHWTTDLNEYNFLASVGWVQEGTDGFILPTQAAGTLPLYRLYLNAAGGLHLWTTDLNERNYLTANAGWIYEGIAGYVIPLQ